MTFLGEQYKNKVNQTVGNLEKTVSKEELIKTVNDKFGLDLSDSKAMLHKTMELIQSKNTEQAFELTNLLRQYEEILMKSGNGGGGKGETQYKHAA